jgi:REP element-mobilizing transposase RayT
MPQSLSAVYIHLVFSTKDRRPLLRDKPTRDALHSYLGGVSKQLDCPPILVGGVEDHVHLLARFGRTITQAEWVKELKRVSNIWLKERGRDYADFEWQGGLLREPIESRSGEAIHRQSGGTSPQDWVSRRVARTVAQARDGMGREIRLGLNRRRRGDCRNRVADEIISEKPRVARHEPPWATVRQTSPTATRLMPIRSCPRA